MNARETEREYALEVFPKRDIAVVRGEEVLIAHDDVVAQPDDHVILFVTDKRRIPAVERLFQVGLSFF